MVGSLFAVETGKLQAGVAEWVFVLLIYAMIAALFGHFAKVEMICEGYSRFFKGDGRDVQLLDGKRFEGELELMLYARGVAGCAEYLSKKGYSPLYVIEKAKNGNAQLWDNVSQHSDFGDWIELEISASGRPLHRLRAAPSKELYTSTLLLAMVRAEHDSDNRSALHEFAKSIVDCVQDIKPRDAYLLRRDKHDKTAWDYAVDDEDMRRLFMDRLLKLARRNRGRSWLGYNGLAKDDLTWAKEVMRELPVKNETKRRFEGALEKYYNEKARIATESSAP